MTSQATRDALAEMDGWKYEAGPVWQWRRYVNGERVDQLDAVSDEHPHPPTLDGADAAVPEGYVWNRRANSKGVPVWIAWHVHDDADVPLIEIPDTGDKIADLYALALCCRKAMEEKR